LSDLFWAIDDVGGSEEHRLEAYATLIFRTVERISRSHPVSNCREPTAATRQTAPASKTIRAEQNSPLTHLSRIEASFVLKLRTMTILVVTGNLATL
jgi:hypothetical protein